MSTFKSSVSTNLGAGIAHFNSSHPIFIWLEDDEYEIEDYDEVEVGLSMRLSIEEAIRFQDVLQDLIHTATAREKAGED